MLKYLQIVIMNVCLMASIGCETNRPDVWPPTIDEPRKEVGATAVELAASAKTIHNEATGIQKVTTQPQVGDSAGKIVVEAVRIEELSKRLAKVEEQLKQAEKDSQKLINHYESKLKEHENIVASKDKQINELKDKAAEAQRDWWMALIKVGTALFICGLITAIAWKPSLGAGIAGVGVISVGYAQFNLSSGWMPAAIVGTMVVSLIVTIGYKVWRDLKLESKDVMKLAKLATAALDDKKPETAREFLAVLRSEWKEFDAAMVTIKSKEKQGANNG